MDSFDMDSNDSLYNLSEEVLYNLVLARSREESILPMDENDLIGLQDAINLLNDVLDVPASNQQDEEEEDDGEDESNPFTPSQRSQSNVIGREESVLPLDLVAEVSRKIAGYTKRLGVTISDQKKIQGSEHIISDLDSLYKRGLTVLRRAGVPTEDLRLDSAEDDADDDDYGDTDDHSGEMMNSYHDGGRHLNRRKKPGESQTSKTHTEQLFDTTENTMKNTRRPISFKSRLLRHVASLLSTRAEKRAEAARELRRAFLTNGKEATADLSMQNALPALAKAFATATKSQESQVQAASAAAIAALIPLEKEPTALLQDAPALLAALQFVLQRPEVMQYSGCEAAKSVALALLSCTVQLQQGWHGDEQDMERAADELMRKNTSLTGMNSPKKNNSDGPSPRVPLRRAGSNVSVENDIQDSDENSSLSTIESKAKLALRTLEAIVRLVHEAALASNLCSEEQATTSSMVAFAMRNLAELPAARLPLIKHGALGILTDWLQRRPCTELHRNAVGALAALCEPELTESSLSGAMAALSSVLDQPTVHDRGFMDGAINTSGALAALLPLVAAPIATVRVYAVNALANLAHRSPNRVLLVENGAIHALIDVLARSVRELRSEPRRAAATVLAEKAVAALTDLCSSADLLVFAPSAAADSESRHSLSAGSSSRMPKPFDAFLSATSISTSSMHRGSNEFGLVHRTSSLSLRDSTSSNEDSPRLRGGFLEEATRRESITEQRQQLEGQRIGSLIVKTGGLSLLAALVTLAEPCSTLRAMAIHGIALLTDEERGCGPELWDTFFQCDELPMVRQLRGDQNLSDDDEDEDTCIDNVTGGDGRVMPKAADEARPSAMTQRSRSVSSCSSNKPSRKQRLLAPAAVDILLRVGTTLDCECPDNDLAILATLLGDDAHKGLLYREQCSQQRSSPVVGKKLICCRTNSVVPADVLEARCVALVLANLATRRDLASELVWRRGAVPLLLRFACSTRTLLRIFAMRALASLAIPLLAAPDKDRFLNTDDGPKLLNLQAAAHTAAVLAHVALTALDGAMIATRDRLRDETRRSLSRETESAALQSTTTTNVVGDDEARAEELTYEAVRAVKVLALAPPLRTSLVARSLRYLLCIAIDSHNPLPQLRALAEAALVTLGFEGGANDLEVCGNDAKLLEEWFAMRQALGRQQALQTDYLAALSFAWPPPCVRPCEIQNINESSSINPSDGDGDLSTQPVGLDSSASVRQEEEVESQQAEDIIVPTTEEQGPSTPRVSDTSSPGGWGANLRAKLFNRVFRRPANLLRCASADNGEEWLPPPAQEETSSPTVNSAAVTFMTPTAPGSSTIMMARTPTRRQSPVTTPMTTTVEASVSPLELAENNIMPAGGCALVVIETECTENNTGRRHSDFGPGSGSSPALQSNRIMRSVSAGHRGEDEVSALRPAPPRPNRLATNRRGSSSESGVEAVNISECAAYDQDFVIIVKAANDLYHWWDSRFQSATSGNTTASSSDDDPVSRKLSRERANHSSTATAGRGIQVYGDESASGFHSVLARVTTEAFEQFKVSADDGDIPPQLLEYYKEHFPSALQRRRVTPMHRVPGGSTHWSPRCTRVLVMPARQYFSFRREGRVVQRVIKACDESHQGGRWGLVFRDAAFDGEFRTSLHTCLSKNPTIESLAFVWTKTPVISSGASGTALLSGSSGNALSGGGGLFSGSSFDTPDDGASALFGGGSTHTSAGLSTELTNLVGQLPRSVAAITFDRALGSEALIFLGNLLRMAEQSRVSQQSSAIHNQGSSAAPISSAGPLLSLLAIRNHNHLQLNDFTTIIQYLNTCTATPPLPPPVDASFSRSLRWLDLSGNRLGDKGVSLVLMSLARADSSVTSLDLSDNTTGPFATLTLNALCGESAQHSEITSGAAGAMNSPSMATSGNEFWTDTELVPGTGQATSRGALFCGSRLRYLSLGHNFVGPVFAARLLVNLADVPHVNGPRSSLRGLSLESSALHPPCKIGALQDLGMALRQLARFPGRLEELDLNRCKLVSKCGKELLRGLIEAHVHPLNRNCDPEDEFAGHESETDTESGQLFPPMPSLLTAQVSSQPVSERSTSNDVYSVASTAASTPAFVRRAVSEPLSFLHDEEHDPDIVRNYRVDADEFFGSLGGLDDDFDEHDDASVESGERPINGRRGTCYSRLSFVRIADGNSLDPGLVKKIRFELRHNRLHRIHRAAMRRQSLRQAAASTPREPLQVVTAEAKPIEETLMAVATAVAEPVVATAVQEDDEESTVGRHRSHTSSRRRIRPQDPAESKDGQAVHDDALAEDDNESFTSISSGFNSDDEELGTEETKEEVLANQNEHAVFERRTQSWPAGASQGATPSNSIEIQKRQRRRGRRAAKRAARAAQGGRSIEKFSVCALFSAPLAYQVQQSGTVNGIDALDFDAERERIKQGFDQARYYRDGVRVRFDVATIERLRTYVIMGKCDILHIAGHGHPKYLTFEDGRGGLQLLTPQGISKLMELTAAAKNAKLPKLAFVCACHSRLAADAFVKAGVRHVVAVALDAPLLDAAALEFTQAFYLAVAAGNSVASAFDIGVQAVANSSQVEGSSTANATSLSDGRNEHGQQNKATGAAKPKPSALPQNRSSSIITETFTESCAKAAGQTGAGSHSKRFELLPKDGSHDEILIPRSSETCSKPLPAAHWPPEYEENDGLAKNTVSVFFKRYGSGLPRPPRPPEDFLGREVEMYRLVENLARKRRLISVVGRAGSGKSALVAAVAVYVLERHVFGDGVLFLRLDEPLAFSYEEVEGALRDALMNARHRSGGRRHRAAAAAAAAAQQMSTNHRYGGSDYPGTPGTPGALHTMLSPFEILKDAKLLLIIQGLEKVDPTAKHLILKQIMDEADGVCVLSSSREPLTRQPAAFTEFVVRIGPLSLPSAARLFARQCPQLHTATDRKNFIRSIAEHPHDKRFRSTLQSLNQRIQNHGPIAAVNTHELSARERRIILELGNGYPGDIVARAFDTTKQSLRTLIEIAKPTPEDEATDNSTIRLAQLTAAGSAASAAAAAATSTASTTTMSNTLRSRPPTTDRLLASAPAPPPPTVHTNMNQVSTPPTTDRLLAPVTSSSSALSQDTTPPTTPSIIVASPAPAPDVQQEHQD